MNTVWREIRVRANTIYGLLPYSAKLNWGVQLNKTDGYDPRKAIPYVTVQITTLDYVWNPRLSREHGRLHMSWTKTGTTDKRIGVQWTPTEGWTIRRSDSGRRTRPLPKFIAAMLCGTLIWVYPDILRITLAHAEKANQPTQVYVLLTVVTFTLAVMIGIYMWFCYKAQPTGLDQLLAKFGNKSEGDGSERDATAKTEPEPERPSTLSPKDGDDRARSPQVDDSSASSPDTSAAKSGSSSTSKGTER